MRDFIYEQELKYTPLDTEEQVSFDLDDNFLDNYNEKHRDIAAYGDTDSIYVAVKTRFDKYSKDGQKKIIDYIDKISKQINRLFIEAMTVYGWGINPEWNKMNFKTEKIATKMVLFGNKKDYIVGKFFDEGTHLDTIKPDVTGGHMSKSDTSEFSKKVIGFLHNISISEKFNNMPTYKLLIETLVERKFLPRLNEIVHEGKYDEIWTPKKWNTGLKNEPSHVTSAKWFNLFIADEVTVGSVMVIPAKFNTNYFLDEFILNSDVTAEQVTKMNYVSFPPHFMENEDMIRKFNTLLKKGWLTIDKVKLEETTITKKVEKFLSF
jgi:hypothetical protein